MLNIIDLHTLLHTGSGLYNPQSTAHTVSLSHGLISSTTLYNTLQHFYSLQLYSSSTVYNETTSTQHPSDRDLWHAEQVGLQASRWSLNYYLSWLWFWSSERGMRGASCACACVCIGHCRQGGTPRRLALRWRTGRSNGLPRRVAGWMECQTYVCGGALLRAVRSSICGIPAVILGRE